MAEASSLLDQSKAQARLAAARVATAEADRETAVATLDQTEGDVVGSWPIASSPRSSTPGSRTSPTAGRSSGLVDEQERDLQAAVAAERTARLAVQTAWAKLNGAAAGLEHAKADTGVARRRSAWRSLAWPRPGST